MIHEHKEKRGFLECSTRYLTSERSHWVRYLVEHKKSNYVYYINTSEIPSELSRENFISSHVKITCYLHTWRDHRRYGYIINRAFESKLIWYFTGVYTINRLLRVQLDVSRVSAANSWDIELSPRRMDVKWYMKCFIYWTADLKSSKHGLIRTHKWPASNVSGFIAQLVGALHRLREVTGSNPVEVLIFLGFHMQLLKLRS